MPDPAPTADSEAPAEPPAAEPFAWPDVPHVEFWLAAAAALLERATNEALAPHGITHRQFQALGVLKTFGPRTQTQLAEALRVERSTVVRILDRMERDGWVERTADPHDRRANRIRPTAAVDPVWETIAAACGEVRTRAFAGLPESRLQELTAALRTVCENLTGTAGGSGE